MKKLKYIRIDETPRSQDGKIFGKDKGNVKFIFLPGDNLDIGNYLDSSAGNGPPKNNPPSFLKGREMGDERQSLFSKGINPRIFSMENSESDLPPQFMEQVMKANDLILEMNALLERRKADRVLVSDFQYDSFKIGLRITDGLIQQFAKPFLAGRQFDLAIIHAENTIINLENLEEEKLVEQPKIDVLKLNLRKLIITIREIKNYLGL